MKVSESRERFFQSCMEIVYMEDRILLVLDIATRWNTTHLILLKNIMYTEEIRNLVEVEATYQTCPSNLEWKRA